MIEGMMVLLAHHFGPFSHFGTPLSPLWDSALTSAKGIAVLTNNASLLNRALQFW